MEAAVILTYVSYVLYGLVGLGVVGGILYYFYVYKKYNKLVLIRDETLAGNIVRLDKAREYYDKDKSLKWKLKSEKAIVECPPKEAISIIKGQKICELVRRSGDHYEWINFKDIDSDAPIIDTISGSSRSAFFNQWKRAISERETLGTKLTQQLVPILAIAILLVFGYLMYDMLGTKINENAAALSGTAAGLKAVAEQQALLMQDMKDIIQDRQTLNSNTPTPSRPVPN